MEESKVSYSPLSEHAAASPFMSTAHRQQMLHQARAPTQDAASQADTDSREPTAQSASTLAAVDHKAPGENSGVKIGKTLTFAQ